MQLTSSDIRVYVCLLHQAVFQGHDHVLIIPLYIPSGTGQTHSRSVIDDEQLILLETSVHKEMSGAFKEGSSPQSPALGHLHGWTVTSLVHHQYVQLKMLI